MFLYLGCYTDGGEYNCKYSMTIFLQINLAVLLYSLLLFLVLEAAHHTCASNSVFPFMSLYRSA